MACVRPNGCICEGNGYCPNWRYDDLGAAYEQPAPDPHACPNCGGDGYVHVWIPDIEDDDGYQERVRCQTCNPNVGRPHEEEGAR